MPQVQQTASGYDIEGQALTARYIRVYVTYYRYGTMTPAENWFYLNEITVMGTLHAGETEPIRMADGDLIISPLYGRIENYQGRTSFILAVPTILGAAADENTALASRTERTGTYRVACTVDGREHRSTRTALRVQCPGILAYELARLLSAACRSAEYGCTPDTRPCLHPGIWRLTTARRLACMPAPVRTGAFHPRWQRTAPPRPVRQRRTHCAPGNDADREVALWPEKPFCSPATPSPEAICERSDPDATPIAGWPGRVGTANCMSLCQLRAYPAPRCLWSMPGIPRPPPS